MKIWCRRQYDFRVLKSTWLVLKSFTILQRTHYFLWGLFRYKDMCLLKAVLYFVCYVYDTERINLAHLSALPGNKMASAKLPTSCFRFRAVNSTPRGHFKISSITREVVISQFYNHAVHFADNLPHMSTLNHFFSGRKEAQLIVCSRLAFTS